MKLKNFVLLFVISIFYSHVAMARDAKFFNQLDIQTVGNHSYVRIGVYKTPDEYSLQILDILKEFEDINLDKQVVDWKIEKQQKTYGITSNYIFGLWIDHKPKVK